METHIIGRHLRPSPFTKFILQGIKIMIIPAILLAVFFLILSEKKNVTPETHTFKVYMKIVSINHDDVSFTKDKFHRAQLCNTILFETIEPINGKILYREINTCDRDLRDIHIDNVWIYNHDIGDTIFFDYLLTSEFFEIK